jgi:phenylacetate-coenzyme A ligase PaaK-like adenylate-forming protein
MRRLDYHRKRLRDLGAALGAGRAVTEREHWARERLEHYQQERLEALVRDVRARSPYWAARLPRGRVALEQLPRMDKVELMGSFDELVTDRRLRRDELFGHLERIDRDELYLGEYRAMATSGSSGRKGVFVYDRQAWIGILAQFLRYSAWIGIKPKVPRMRIASVAGGVPTHMSQRVAASVAVGIHRVTPLAATAPLASLVEQLNAAQPEALNAYPSMARLLADEQVAGRLRLRLRLMSTSSEPLPAETRDRLERAFGVRPFNLYGTTEGLWGCDCAEHAGVHLFEDFTIVENVDADGRPVPAGESGARLLVTNLFNRIQPLIRFELGDMVSVDPQPCRCGRTLLRLREIEGRSEDVIRLGGVAVHSMQFAPLSSDPDVREFQVVQEGERLRIRLALRAGANGAAARLQATLAERLRKAGIAEPAIEVEVVERLERPPGGKLALVVADRSLRGRGSDRAAHEPGARAQWERAGG